MGYNPWINAAKAAYAEVSSDEAIAFLKATALSHTLLVTFYALEAVYWTVEAGRLTRSFVDSFNPPPQPEAVKIAGLLCPAQDESPITTEAIVSNQQKLEQQITQTLQGIYHEFCTEIGSMDDAAANPIVEQADEPGEGVLLLSSSPEPSDSSPGDTRPRKPRAASGNPGKAKTKTTSSRVPRSRSAVSQE